MTTNYLETSDNLLQAVLESFADGVLVLTDRQDIVYANATAQTICSQLWHDEPEALPREIQRVCQALAGSHELFPSQPVMLESEVVAHNTTFRIRAQWLKLEVSPRPCVLLRLQDQNQSTQGLATAEAQKWGLTPRETEVWLLRRSGYSRKAIADSLYIALDTVKKHLKNVHLKRQAALDEADWQSNQAS